MLYFPLHPLIIFVVDKAFGTGGISKKMGDVPYEKREKNAFFISMFVIVLILVYSIFLTYLVGLVMFLTAILNIATTPVGQPFTKGLYCFSRHPMLFSGAITLVGVSMASASWVFLLLSIVYIALQNSEAIAEERGCLKIYGDEY
jgi:protein-S-isoprenylcysteine O-methyltransferase Ste14